MARPNSRWMPLDWGDYWRDTAHLSGCEHGGYLNLLGAYWTTGKALPDDDDRLRRLARLSVREWKAAKTQIAEFFEIRDGLWFQKRVETELFRASEVYEKQVARISKINGVKSRQSSTMSSTCEATKSAPPLPSPQPSSSKTKKNLSPKPSNGDDGFPDWYAAYPRKIGRDAARAAYAKAIKRGATPAQLLAAAQAYAERRHGEDPKFTKHPTTWLNGGHWADDDIAPKEADETPEQRATNFYRYFLETGTWLDQQRTLADVPDHIRQCVDAEFARREIEEAGQQQLALGPAVPPPAG